MILLMILFLKNIPYIKVDKNELFTLEYQQISRSTTQRILTKDLHLHAYKF